MNLNKMFKLTCLSAMLVASTHGYANQHNTDNKTTVNYNHNNGMNHAVNDSERTPAHDAVITKSIKKHIKASKILSKLNVQTSTKEGVVHFTGTVDSDTQVTLLVELAESIVGVTDVNTSELEIKDGKQPVADALTTAKIKGLFIREKLFGEKDIAAINTSVETKDGIVYLSGDVDNKEQIDNAIKVIKTHFPDMKDVQYKVRVNDNVNNSDVNNTDHDKTVDTNN